MNVNQEYILHVADMHSSLNGIGEKISFVSGSERLEEKLETLRKQFREYEAMLVNPFGDFNERRETSKTISHSITELRMAILNCYQNSSSEELETCSELLDETLLALWDPHIRHDMETYSKEQMTRAFDSILNVFKSFDDWVKHVDARVETIARNASELDQQVKENNARLQGVKRKLNEIRPAASNCYTPVILPARKIRANERHVPQERKRPVLRVVK
jgi:prefoldin subunit 5